MDAYERTYGDSLRCVYECQDVESSTEWIALSPGKDSCEDDCIQACGGRANLDPSQDQQRNLFDVPCTRSDHCSTGQFSIYEGVRCEFAEVPENAPRYDDWQAVGGLQPRCVIPPTRRNADLECQEYGGAARGGLCTRLPEGANPQSYELTRPYINDRGEYDVQDVSDHDSISALNAWLDGNEPSGQSYGLCYLYGYQEDVEYEFMEEIPVGIKVGVGAEVGTIAEVEPSSRYVCAVRKMSTCGTVQPDSGMEVPYANLYECVFPDRVGLEDPNRWCFPESQSAELCAGEPGMRCCAYEMGVGCQDDLDCIPPKKCMNIDPATGYGECDFDPVCDPEHPERRCRSASEGEKRNSAICSPPLHVLPGFGGTRCVNPNHACCEDPSTLGVGDACAADMIGVPNPSGADWSNYTCVDNENIPDNQYIQTGRGRELIDWQSQNSYCIPNSVPAGGELTRSIIPDQTTAQGIELGSQIERCSQGKTCCSLSHMLITDYSDYLMNPDRRDGMDVGTPCPGFDPSEDPPMVCYGTASVDDAFAQERGYQDANQFLYALANSGYCQMTPLTPGIYDNTKECAQGLVCCLSSFPGITQDFCSRDADCNSGEVCDVQIHQCMPDEAFEEAQEEAEDNCFQRAVILGDMSALELKQEGHTAEEFSCQTVSSTQADALIRQKQCLRGGCEDEQATAELIQTLGVMKLCCLPGVGIAPPEAALVSERAAEIERGKFTIGLPACIATGNCGLDDIVVTGANFANMLIGLSGSVFLAIFVYAGFLYLTAGTSDRVSKAKKMLVQSTVAMVLILGAFVFVRFIQQSLIAGTVGTSRPTCGQTEDTQGYACIYLNVDPADAKALDQAIKEFGCKRGMCLDDPASHYVCCPVTEEAE